MSEGISIQKLIDQVRKELLEPTKVAEYPVFLVEKVELELAVAISANNKGGISISILDIVSGELSREAAQQRGHTIKISLAPILTPEEIKTMIPATATSKIEKATRMALIKSVTPQENDLDDWG